MAGKLVICPTPIGNLGDMTQRALDALRSADTVCAEDTRMAGKLLAAFGIGGKRVERLDENLMAQRTEAVLERVRAGETIVYCTDAGMPGVSDPGLRLVRAAREAGDPVAVEVLPGPTAVATAYVASGCTDAAFFFGGFFPRKAGERRALLEGLRGLDAALIFYESPNRLVSALSSICQVFPLRTMAVCRELTKMHEEIVRGSVAEVYAVFAERESERGAGIKGEIVLVIDGPSAEERRSDAADALDRAAARAAELAQAGMRPKEIAKTLSCELGISRNDAYDAALRAKDDRGQD